VDDHIGGIYVDVCDGLVSFRVVVEAIKLGCYSSDGGNIPGKTPSLISSSLAYNKEKKQKKG
jgi:hypothetical protein